MRRDAANEPGAVVPESVAPWRKLRSERLQGVFPLTKLRNDLSNKLAKTAMAMMRLVSTTASEALPLLVLPTTFRGEKGN